jgi:hypothetical protein
MPHERTLYEATLDCRFGRQFSLMNARLYQRIDFVFGFVSLFGGSTAFGGAIAQNPTLAGAAGVVLAVASILERLMAPALKAHEFKEHAKRFADLDARAHSMDVAHIDSELRRLQAEGPMGFEALALPAHNANLLSNGHADMVEALPLGSRFLRALV